MISKPTTTQILEDCCRCLLDEIIPAVPAGPTQVQLAMLEGVLRNMAVRAAHEIAWMEEEREAIGAYAARVAAQTGGGDAGGGDLRPALEAATPPASLHLDDVVAAYERASEALSCAIEASLKAGDASLTGEGTALLETRLAGEREILAGWGDLAGR